MIRLRGLKVSFNGRPVLNGLDLDLPDDRITVILGKSGIGKSVMLKAVMGLVDIQGGTAEIDGEELFSAPQSRRQELRGRIGMLLQNGGLFDSMNVFDNIAFPLRYHKKAGEAEIKDQVEHYAALVDIAHALRTFPKDLSGGMRRRAALARAIIQKPQYLFYDEPTAGLDPTTSALVEILIRKVKEDLGITTLVVTHDVDMVHFLGEEIALLDEGVIVCAQNRQTALASGSPIWDNFIAKRELIHREHGF